jgi:hypothetical protein
MYNVYAYTLAYDTFVKKNSPINILQMLIISAHGLWYGLKMAQIKGQNM